MSPSSLRHAILIPFPNHPQRNRFIPHTLKDCLRWGYIYFMTLKVVLCLDPRKYIATKAKLPHYSSLLYFWNVTWDSNPSATNNQSKRQLLFCVFFFMCWNDLNTVKDCFVDLLEVNTKTEAVLLCRCACKIITHFMRIDTHLFQRCLSQPSYTSRFQGVTLLLPFSMACHTVKLILDTTLQVTIAMSAWTL